MYRRRLLLRFGLLVCLGMAWLAVWLWQIVTRSLQAEMTHQAYTLTLELVEVYMRDNPGKWVKSWEDLEHVIVPPDRHHLRDRWPQGIDEVRKRVRINFELTRDQVAAMNVEGFSAVQPVGPNYGPNEPRIEVLLKAARR
jgi:hypothetical protein